MRLRVSWEPSHQRYGMYVTNTDGADNSSYLVQCEPWRPCRRFEQIEPLFEFTDKHDLQELFDSMWQCGCRPSESQGGYKAELTATKNHLNDMRAITSGMLEIEL